MSRHRLALHSELNVAARDPMDRRREGEDLHRQRPADEPSAGFSRVSADVPSWFAETKDR